MVACVPKPSPAALSTPSPQASLMSPSAHPALSAMNQANTAQPYSPSSLNNSSNTGPVSAAMAVAQAPVSGSDTRDKSNQYFSNLVAVKNGKVTEISLRSFDLIEECNTTMSENDVALSLSMFGAVKGQKHARIFYN